MRTRAPVRGGLTALLTLCAAAACANDPPSAASPVAFDTARAWVVTGDDSVPLLVEVARTEEQRARGLQRRAALDEGSGMIFLYDSVRPPDEGFWMWRTRVPLDLAYLGPGGEIVAVRAMEPCESPVPEWCREEAEAYRPGVAWSDGLEVNRGWLDRHGAGVGSRVLVDTAEASGGG